ncbi:lipase family protein [Mycolicibacterium pallens]|uniref:Lipase n=1 Tax=Mycolicibacterium pallens TaxID=370524 RepID=A0ABX8VPR2_9MYCO|nr:lipase family protein [Mycolicibacterium pallens]QYL17449.1 lipase [Mycolicibacterium pallens]
MTRRGLALVSAAVLVLSACGSHPAPEAKQTTSRVLGSVPLTNVVDSLRDAAASMNVVTHVSRSGINDWESRPTASVFVPKGAAPQGGFPIVVLGHHITGLSPGCAPSQSATLDGLAPAVEALLRTGYVVAVPDLQGLGPLSADPTPSDKNHPYLDSATAGYNMIDAARATHEAVPQTSAQWVAVGAGEGGQGAWAANELAINYSEDNFKIVGSVSISPMADVDGLADAAWDGILTDDQKVELSRLLAGLHGEYPDVVKLDDFRRGAATQQWDALLGCQPAPSAQQVAAQIPAADLRPASEDALATLRGFLKKITLPQAPAQAPMMVLYGDADPLTPAAWTDRALDAACKFGDTITIQKEPQAQPASEAQLAWIADRFAGKPAPNDCAGRP